MRYHNKRKDFSVTDSSRIKVKTNGVHLMVQVDEKNTGEWVDCVEVLDMGLGQGSTFLRNAHLGVTATTGQLADNHDIISFESFR
jgi:mannose-binding lectin 2